MTDPWAGNLPAMSPEDPRDAQPVPRRRRWYQAPGTLLGAATFSGVSAWLTLLLSWAAYGFAQAIGDSGGIAILLWLVLGPILLIIVFGALIGLALTVVGAIATVPLAVVWFRTPDRDTAAGVAVIHAVVAWAALVTAAVWAA